MTPITQNADESYTYSFATFPATYANPVNATTGGGGAVTAGTYTVGIEARRTFIVEGASVRKAGDATFDFAVGGAALSPRQVVTQANCDNCHVQMTVHGENRFKLTGCVLCHTTGSEDRITTPATTPGVTIAFTDMIHRLHRGADLPRVKATANGADPYRYEVIGFGESVNDFSDVVFPFMPGGTGFNQQTRNCAACHGAAAQGGLTHADASINQANSRSCHDDISFTDGKILDTANATVAAGTLTKAQLTNAAFRTTPGGVAHVFPDGSCKFCHGDGLTFAVETVHLPELSNPANINGIRVVINSVTGTTGGDPFFKAGDIPVITFDIRDGNNNQIAINDATQVVSISLVMSGPVENYQLVLPTTGTSATVKSTTFDAGGNVTAQTINAVPNTGIGPFTYTAAAIPVNYRAPLNDSADFDFAGGWGELYTAAGTPLVAGSYTIMVWAAHEFPIPSTTRYREASPPGLFPIRIGSAGTAASYPGHVTDAECNACHGDLRFHGNGRKGVQGCVMCHVAGAEDRPNPAPGQPAQAPEPDSVDMKIMIHKIHNARELSVVKNGGKYDLIGFLSGAATGFGAVVDFSTAYTPVMPDGAKNCVACHATDTWKVPVERADVNIWKVACTSCHDSAAVAAHVALNTLAGAPGQPGTEACAVCHGAGAVFSVESSHASP